MKKNKKQITQQTEQITQQTKQEKTAKDIDTEYQGIALKLGDIETKLFLLGQEKASCLLKIKELIKEKQIIESKNENKNL